MLLLQAYVEGPDFKGMKMVTPGARFAQQYSEQLPQSSSYQDMA